MKYILHSITYIPRNVISMILRVVHTFTYSLPYDSLENLLLLIDDRHPVERVNSLFESNFR